MTFGSESYRHGLCLRLHPSKYPWHSYQLVLTLNSVTFFFLHHGLPRDTVTLVSKSVNKSYCDTFQAHSSFPHFPPTITRQNGDAPLDDSRLPKNPRVLSTDTENGDSSRETVKIKQSSPIPVIGDNPREIAKDSLQRWTAYHAFIMNATMPKSRKAENATTRNPAHAQCPKTNGAINAVIFIGWASFEPRYNPLSLILDFSAFRLLRCSGFTESLQSVLRLNRLYLDVLVY